MTWVAGVAPQSSAGPDEDDIVLSEEDPPWPVQVGLSEDAAFAIDLEPGDRLTVEDQYGQDIRVRISGIFSPDDPDDPAWTVARELLSPAVGTVRRRRAHLGGGAGLVGVAARPADRRAVRRADRADRVPARPGAGAAGSRARTCSRTSSSSRPRPAWPVAASAGTARWTACSTTRRPRSRTRVDGRRCSWSGCSSPRSSRWSSPPCCWHAGAPARSPSPASGGRRWWASAPSSRWSHCWSRWPARPSGSRSPRPWSGRSVGAGCCPSSRWRRWPPRCSAPSRRAGPRAPVECPPTAPLGVPRIDDDGRGAWCWRRRSSGWPSSRSSLCSNAARSRATSLRSARPRCGRWSARSCWSACCRRWCAGWCGGQVARLAGCGSSWRPGSPPEGCARCRWSSWWSPWPSSSSALRWPRPSSAARRQARCSPSAVTPGSRRCPPRGSRTWQPRSARRPASTSRSPAGSPR